MKNVLAVFVVAIVTGLSGVACFGQEPDFQVTWHSLIVNRLTDESIAKIQAIENKESLRVATTDEATDEQLQVICSWPWVRRLRVNGGEQLTSLAPLAKRPEITELRIDLDQKSGDRIDLGPVGKLVKLKRFSVSTTAVANTDALVPRHA